MDKNHTSPLILIGIDAAVATLTEKFLQAGHLPNLRNLISHGAYTRVEAVFPGVTPVNWASISTGSYPGTHGITDFQVLNPGDQLNAGHDGFMRSSYQAEPLWEAALQQGIKCATLDFPGADKSLHPGHIWIADRGSPAGITPYAIRNLTCLATPDLSLRDAHILEKVDENFSARLDPQYIEGEGPLLTFKVSVDQQGIQGILVSLESEGTEEIFIYQNRTSQWVWSDFSIEGKIKRASYRLMLTRFKPEIPSFVIYVSQITTPQDIAQPAHVGEDLVHQIGPFIGYDGARAIDRDWVSPYHMIDEGYYKALWQARAARILVEKYGCQLVMLKWHLIDHIQHSFWGGIDPLSPWYPNSNHEACTDLVLGAYQAADAMIGTLLPLLDQGATLCVVSDHGHIPHLKAVALNNLLLQEGLIQLIPGITDPPEVDWWQTRAYGGPALGHIWINERGRYPRGCVDSQSYENVREKVIQLLKELRDPETHERVVAKVFRKEEAQSIGLWGSRTGDIIYWMKPGYSGDFNWTPLSRNGRVIENLVAEHEEFAEYGEGKFIANKFQSVHGCGDPSARLGVGTEEAILVMAGERISTNQETGQIPNLTCVAPTLCAATRLPLPNQSQSEILESWIRV